MTLISLGINSSLRTILDSQTNKKKKAGRIKQHLHYEDPLRQRKQLVRHYYPPLLEPILPFGVHVTEVAVEMCTVAGREQGSDTTQIDT